MSPGALAALAACRESIGAETPPILCREMAGRPGWFLWVVHGPKGGSLAGHQPTRESAWAEAVACRAEWEQGGYAVEDRRA